MSKNYDNWERLVAAVIKREEDWQLCHQLSITTISMCSEASSISNFGSSSSYFEVSDDVMFKSENNQESAQKPVTGEVYTICYQGFNSHAYRSAIGLEMSTDDLLHTKPLELQFPFELKKQISCSLQLSNKSDNYVAFKFKTTNLKRYCVKPNPVVVLPRSTRCDVIVKMQAQKQAPADMQCRDKFLIQCVAVRPGSTAKDITSEMFSKESGNHVEECKLRVSYVTPPQSGSGTMKRIPSHSGPVLL